MRHSTPMKTLVERMREKAGEDNFRLHHRAIVREVDNLTKAVLSLESLALTRSPMETEAAHARRTADAARRLENAVHSAQERISNTVADGAHSLSERIDERAGLRESPYAAEIRASVRGMPEKARYAVLRAAAANGEAETVAALTGAPTVVTGYSQEYRDRMREHYREQHAPEEYQALTDLTELLSTASLVTSSAIKAATEATDPDFLAKVAQEEEAANRAQSQFNESLQY